MAGLKGADIRSMSGEQRAQAAAVYEDTITNLRALIDGGKRFTQGARDQANLTLKLLEIELQSVQLGHGGVSVADLQTELAVLKGRCEALEVQNGRLRRRVAELLTSGWSPPGGKVWTDEDVAAPIVVEVQVQQATSPETTPEPEEVKKKAPAKKASTKKKPAAKKKAAPKKPRKAPKKVVPVEVF